MSTLHQHTAFLCGHFTTSGTATAQELPRLGWQKFVLPDDIRQVQKRFFYPEFVDFCYSDESVPDYCIRYFKHVDEELKITIRDTEIAFYVKELTLYLMPFNTVLFSIHVEHSAEDLNNCTLLLFQLRAIDYYAEEHMPFIEKAITPIMEAYKTLTGETPSGYSCLMEHGNKLRIFQIINTFDEQMAALSDSRKDKLLYELGTLSKITQEEEVSDFSPSDSYLEKILDQSRISVFRNWSGLALMDTFTIHAFNCSKRFVDNWTDSYFQMIYIHSIFQKSYLFALNIRFRKTMAHTNSTWKKHLNPLEKKSEDISQLLKEFELFEQELSFHKISYNFLPLEIAATIDKGLEIKEEMEQLYKIMEKVKTRKDEANDRMVNNLLFSLSLLTLASTIWDIACLIDQMYPFAEYMGGQTLGYRTVTLLLLLAVLFLIFTIYRRKQK